MKLPHFLISFLISVSFNTTAYTQQDSLRNAMIMQHLANAIEVYNPCHYNAQMRFKEMGGDTFEIRNFSISYRANPANLLYGYDWEFMEEQISGANTFMILADAMYMIFEDSKTFVKCPLLLNLEPGSYTEYVRDFSVISQMLYPFISVSPSEIKLNASGDYYHLTRQMNAMATRELLVTRDTYLPVQSISTIKDGEFDMVQIQEVNFYYDDHIKKLPDTAFLIEHYVSLGYAIHQNNESELPEKIEITAFPPESKELLLYYPFVKASGDTTSLMASLAGYILLDFWYASCMPCLQAMPDVNKLQETYAKNGLQVIGINCFDIGIRENVVKRLQEKNITMPLYFGSRDLVRALEINSFPSYVLITPDRQVQLMDGSVDDIKKILSTIFKK